MTQWSNPVAGVYERSEIRKSKDTPFFIQFVVYKTVKLKPPRWWWKATGNGRPLAAGVNKTARQSKCCADRFSRRAAKVAHKALGLPAPRVLTSSRARKGA